MKRVSKVKIHRKKCKTCVYRASPFADNGCDYIIIERHSRGCSPENCDKYKRGPKIRLQKGEW